MAKISKKARSKLPSSVFAGPNRSFPIPDKNHAKAALFDLKRSYLSPDEKMKVHAAAMRKLHGK